MKSNLIKMMVILLMATIVISCKADKAKSKPSTDTATPAVIMKTNALPSISQEDITHLADKCTYIDYLWNDLPFSVSQGEKEAILTALTFISAETMKEVPTSCKSIGRQSFQVGGDFYLEADIYYGDGCNYYIFYKDNKPVALNKISEAGTKFFGNLIAQAMQQRQQIINK